MELLWTLQKRCRSATGVVEHYRTLWSIAGRYRMLWNDVEALQIIMERYGSITETLQNIIEPLQKILILTITTHTHTTHTLWNLSGKTRVSRPSLIKV